MRELLEAKVISPQQRNCDIKTLDRVDWQALKRCIEAEDPELASCQFITRAELQSSPVRSALEKPCSRVDHFQRALQTRPCAFAKSGHFRPI